MLIKLKSHLCTFNLQCNLQAWIIMNCWGDVESMVLAFFFSSKKTVGLGKKKSVECQKLKQTRIAKIVHISLFGYKGIIIC